MTRPRRPLSRFVRRVTACFALLFVLTWVNGVFAVTQLNRIESEAHDAIEGGLASTAVLGQLSSAIAGYRALEAAQIAQPSRDPLEREAERRQLQAQVSKLSRRYESLDSSDEQKRLFMKFLAGWYDYDRRSQAVFQALSAGNRPAALAGFQDGRQGFNEASDTIGELITITIQHGRVIEEDLHGIFLSSLSFILTAVSAVSLLIVGIVLAVAWREDGPGDQT
ncbi:MAG: hypothetical protein F8N37_17515 [Telmatospirillum sp.]|nr:hypothetical protein [Telmatospirillum sp.]